MTLNDAKKLKWGTLLQPSQTAKSRLHEYRDAIFIGISKDVRIAAIPRGDRTIHYYAPVFWNVKPEVKS